MPSSQKAEVDVMEAGGYFDKGYTVFMDNCYTSHSFSTASTNPGRQVSVGTVRTNRRHTPRDLQAKKKGESGLPNFPKRDAMLVMEGRETCGTAERGPLFGDGAGAPGTAV